MTPLRQVSSGDASEQPEAMTQVVLLCAVTALVFMGLDMPGIHNLVRPVFETHVGDLLAAPLRLGPAAVFSLSMSPGFWSLSRCRH